MRKILFAMFALSFSGCTTMQPRYDVQVDSISAANKSFGKKYVLLPSDKDTTIRDMQFKEYASHVHKILMRQGYQPVKSLADAEIIIMLAYGIGDPKEHAYTYSSPVFGQTGVVSSNTSGMVSSYGRFATYSAYTTNTPTYGVTGYAQNSGSYTTCVRFILLSAFDLKSKAQNVSDLLAWRTTITSVGSSCDLRKVFPGILHASGGLIGTNTGEKRKVSVYVNDPEISNLRTSPMVDIDVELPGVKPGDFIVGENRRLHLADENVVSGKILSETSTTIEIETKYGKVSVPKKDIKSVE